MSLKVGTQKTTNIMYKYCIIAHPKLNQIDNSLANILMCKRDVKCGQISPIFLLSIHYSIV